jgi:RecB family exonuclease
MADLPPGWRMKEAPEKASGAPLEKAVEEMTDAELDEALRESKRELLNAQRAETEARLSENRPTFGLAFNQRRYFSEFTKPRPYWR